MGIEFGVYSCASINIQSEHQVLNGRGRRRRGIIANKHIQLRHNFHVAYSPPFGPIAIGQNLRRRKRERNRSAEKGETRESLDRKSERQRARPRLSADERRPPSNHENLIEGLPGKDNFLGISLERRTTRRKRGRERWTSVGRGEEGECRANLKSIVDWNASTLILKVTC